MRPVKNTDRCSVGKKLRSLNYALTGLSTFAYEEHNLWLYVTGVLGSVVLGLVFGINYYEWLIQTMVTFLICSVELMNTAVENVVDLASPEFHPLAKKAKDVSSAAVLVVALGGGIVFLLIYGSRFLAFL